MKYLVIAVTAVLCARQAQEPQKPQKEHDLLKQFEGEWEVRQKCFQPAVQESQGTEIAHVKLGGLWLMFEYKGEYNKQPFEGHGMLTFDAQKGCFVGSWMDNFSTRVSHFEGKADATGKTWTMRNEGVDPKTGQPTTYKMIFEITDKDHRSLRMYAPAKDGKEELMSEMLYTRKVSDAK